MGGEVAAKTSDIGVGKRWFGNKVGILGTPVIEITGTSPTTTGAIYVVAESELQSNLTFYHRIWALDITNFSSVFGGSGVCARVLLFIREKLMFDTMHPSKTENCSILHTPKIQAVNARPEDSRR